MDSRVDQRLSAVAFAILVLQVVVTEVSSAPVEDLISKLPGQPAVSFNQYGGYVTVDSKNGRALFYYFVEAESNASTKPLTLWLNGGPGCSSLLGAFEELGPFYPRRTTLYKNDKAWNKVSNMIFLESPAGVGFSYSNTTSDYHTGDAKTAQDALTFLLEWFKKFPEYQNREFYIAGESYAGHYVPQLAAAVLKNNNDPAQPQIHLKGIMVGNPTLNDHVTEMSRIVFMWSHGMLSDTTYKAVMSQCKFFDNTNQESPACIAASHDAAAESSFLFDSPSLPVDPYDVLEDVCVDSHSASGAQLKTFVNGNVPTEVNKNAPMSPCIESDGETYFNLPEVQAALHAKKTYWTECAQNSTVKEWHYAEADHATHMLPVLRYLLHSGLRVWLYSGDQDAWVPLIGTRRLVANLAAESSLNATSPYRIWFQGQQVGGWTQRYGELAYATVRGAGHMVPATQPSRALQLFTSFLAASPLPPSAAASSVP